MADLEKSFWQKRRGQNGNLNGEQTVWLGMFVVFAFAIFFYIGFTAAGLTAEEPDLNYITGEDLVVDAPPEQLEDMITVLVVGADKRPNDVGRSDTILLCFLDVKNKRAQILSVPRDTYVTIPRSGEKTKVNHAYAYGGIPLLDETLEQYLGVSIDYYVSVNFNGFVQLVDALGGIEIDVEKRMFTPEENIDIQPGLQVLNGQDALGYVRFRKDGLGDIGRVERQQHFLKELAGKLMSVSTAWKIPKLADIFMENVETNFSVGELLSLYNTFKDIDLSTLNLQMIPGKGEYINGISYWIGDQAQINTILDGMMNPPPPTLPVIPDVSGGSGVNQ